MLLSLEHFSFFLNKLSVSSQNFPENFVQHLLTIYVLSERSKIPMYHYLSFKYKRRNCDIRTNHTLLLYPGSRLLLLLRKSYFLKLEPKQIRNLISKQIFLHKFNDNKNNFKGLCRCITNLLEIIFSMK